MGTCPASLDSSDSHSAVCDDGANTSSKMGVVRNNSLHQRPRQSRYFLHTCTMMLATITLAGAVGHAAFVTRTGHGSLPKTSANYRGNPCPTGALLSLPSCRISNSNKKSSQTRNIFGSKGRPTVMAKSMRLSSLWMTPPSDVDVQSQDLSSDVEDEEEWRTVLAAFQMYKAAYGDLKVPSRFVVPGMAPWPGEKMIVFNILCKEFGG